MRALDLPLHGARARARTRKLNHTQREMTHSPHPPSWPVTASPFDNADEALCVCGVPAPGYYGAEFLPAERRVSTALTNLRVPRNEVREVLLAKLKPGTVRFGARAARYREVQCTEGGGGGSSGDCGGGSFVEVDVETVTHDASLKVGGGAGRLEGWVGSSGGGEGGGGGGGGAGGGGGNGGGGGGAGPANVVGHETIHASMLVACDGVRSAVQRLRLPNAKLNYLGVILVTGFTRLRHPLLRRQGFYTLDGRGLHPWTSQLNLSR